MALFSYNKAQNEIHINIPRIKVVRKTRAIDEFVRTFMNDDEDEGSGVNVTSPYGQIAWVNIAISKLAAHVARANFEIVSGENVIETGSVYDLFRDVNAYMSKSQLWEATTSWLFMRGECLWLYPIASPGIPTEFFIPDPQRMEEAVDKDGNITLWWYKVDNRRIPFNPNEVIHFKLWNPWNWRRGVNPLKAMDYELSMDLNASRANLSMLRNGAVPDAILATDNPTLSEDQARAIKERWLKEHQGSRRRHTISVLGSGVKYQPVQMTPQDMEYFKMKRWTREAIFARFGIPLVLAGATDEHSPLSGQDTREQMRNFWEGTITPILRFYEDKLDTDFFARHKLAPMEGRFNIDDVSELQEDRNAQYERQRLDVSQGVRTINEVREERGMDPVEWGDTWWAPLSLIPVDSPADTREPETLMNHREWFEKKPLALPGFERKSIWPIEFKQRHWRRVTRTWGRTEEAYKKELQDWVFGIRSHVLEVLTSGKSLAGDNRKKAPTRNIIDEIDTDEWWETAAAEVARITNRRAREAMLAAEPAFKEVLRLAGITLDSSWSIFNTTAVFKLNDRLTKISRITKTIREDTRSVLKDAIANGWTDQEAAQAIGDLYNQAKSRCATIARTEIGGAINDAEIASYIDVGFEYHSWLPTFDEDVRDSHRIGMDGNPGETVAIGEKFSNGLRWPHDTEGPGEETINCRCLTLPEKDK